ncbi:MAG: hypothetical protein WCK49_04535 [Myxococcaceae bacterium]
MPGLIFFLAFAALSYETDCDWYTNANEASWLPTGYAKAASCACSLKGLAGANSTTARCVRHLVQESHKGEFYFSAEQKYSLPDIDTFAEIVHQLHVDAYAQCSCPGSPAPLWAWNLVSWIGLPTQYLCSLEISAIQKYGPCGCDGW